MRCFKKPIPLFLAAVFSFASAAAFSQVTPTRVAECDRFLQEFGIVAPILLEKQWPSEVTDQDRRIINAVAAEKVQELGQSIRDNLADGTKSRKEAAVECKKWLSELSKKSGEVLNKRK